MPFFSIKLDIDRYSFPRLPGFSSLRQRSQVAGKFFSFELNDFFGHSNNTRTVALSFLVLGLMALLSTLSFQLWQHDVSIAEENALLELSQGTLLLFASFTIGLRAWLARSSKSLNKDIFLALSFFFLAFFLREVDIDKLGKSPNWVVVERVVRSITVLAIGAFMLSLLTKMKLLLLSFFRMLKTPVVMVTIVACLLYACGWFFDKEVFPITKSLSRCIEEIIELNACLLFAIAAFARGIKTLTVKPL